MWAPWDEPAQVAARVLQAHGIKAKVTGFDGHPSAIAAVKEPNSLFAATAAQPFEEMCRRIAEWIQTIVLDGKDPRTLFRVPAVTLIVKPSTTD